jgi:hypothetical protein
MIEKLKEMLGQEPFIAFNIVVNSGSSYHVESSWQIDIGKTIVNYLYPSSDAEAHLKADNISGI